MFPLEMTRPGLLFLLLPAAAALGWYFYRSLSDFPLRQRIVSLVIRSLLVLCIVLALTGIAWLRPTNRLFVLFAIDQSASVNEEGKEAARTFIEDSLKEVGGNRAAWLSFGETAGPVQWELDWERLNTLSGTNGSVGAKTNANGTNIAEALEAAAGSIPPGYVPRIVLLSDGNETVGDGRSAAMRGQVPIYSIPLPSRKEPEVQVAAVTVPAEVQEGEPFFVDVVIQSNHEDEGLIEIFRGDHKVVSERKPLKEGENLFRFQQSMDRDRLAAYTVRISGLREDTLLDNNSESGLVFASGKPRVLIIESDPNLIRELAYALEDEGIQADVRPPQGMPDTLADLQNYECLLLSNVPATSLTTQQMQVARTYVQDLGGGFIMLGGEQSFGLGGYYKSALEDILPVRSDFEKEKEKPSLGIVLTIDKSGSMSGDNIEMAKSAARAAVDLLGRRDQVAVIAFDGDTYVISDMQPATNASRIHSEIAQIEAGGGTTMYPAMEKSYELLNATSAKLKHLILLTDGVSTPGDFEGLAQQMASAKITVSTVAMGEGSDSQTLENIAKVGRGRFYMTADPSQIPQIFAKETITASKSAIDEQPFVPQTIRATHALADIDMDVAPFLLGYVRTRPKPTSEVILATEKGDPLLAWWRYGLGMTTAFTSDAKARWAAEWMTWPGYGKFWTQVVRQTMRKNETKGIQVALNRSQNLATLDVDTVSEIGQFLNDATVEVTVIQPGLKQSTSTLNQTAPGKYEGSFPTDRPGAYHAEITVKQNDEVVYRQSRGLMVGYSDELRIRPTDETYLQGIASNSQGRFNATAQQIFEPDARLATHPFPLWPWLLFFASLLLVIDVALRRIVFDRVFNHG